MSAQLLVCAAGPGVTLQDAGRFGHARHGVTPAGPMDMGAYLAATRAAGACEAIEVSLGGATFRCEGSTILVAVAGGDFDISVDGRMLPPACVFPLASGSQLTIRAGVSGAWCYVAIGACVDIAPTLGSLATHARSGLGPKPLAAGDCLPLVKVVAPTLAPLTLRAPWLAPIDAPIRVLLGPQADYFSLQSLERFLSAEWRVSARSDRMAYALEGPRIEHERGHDIVSDGAVMGAIQVPGGGAPFVLMADRQPTGGYPKIACAISADLGRLAQLRPGERLRFQRVNWDEAVAARAAMWNMIAAAATTHPLGFDLSTEALLRENLVGGVVSAKE